MIFDITDIEYDELLSESKNLDELISKARFDMGVSLALIYERFEQNPNVSDYDDDLAILEYEMAESSKGIISKLLSWIEKGFNMLFKKTQRPSVEEFYAMKDRDVVLDINPKEEISKVRKFKEWLAKWTNPQTYKKIIPPAKDIVALTGIAVVGGMVFCTKRKKDESKPGSKYRCKAIDLSRDLDMYNREMDSIQKTLNKNLNKVEKIAAKKDKKDEKIEKQYEMIQNVKQSMSGFFSGANPVLTKMRNAIKKKTPDTIQTQETEPV